MFRKTILFLPVLLSLACNLASAPASEAHSNENQPAETQPAPITSEAGTSSTKEAFGIYMSLSKDGSNQCTFGEVTHCRLFFAEVTSSNGAFSIADESLKEILPDVPAVMPSVSPDGTLLAFMASADSGSYQLRHIYVYNLETGFVLDVTAGQSASGTGQWVRWSGERELVYSSLNDCSNAVTKTGCNKESRYQDLLIATLNPDGTAVLNTEIAFGSVNDSTLLNSEACAAEDPAPSGDPNMIAFHSTSVDGSQVRDAACPWVEGYSGIMQQGNSVPVIVNLNATSPDNTAQSLTAGEDYWAFDLSSAGLKGCAHMDFSADGQTVVCTEQGSSPSYRLCSDPNFSGQECMANGGYGIVYDRIFGFSLNGNVYQNVHGATSQTPLFEHLHPTALPNAERYWRDDKQCAIYLTKYSELGNDNLLLATILCQSGVADTDGIIFSRLMLIDFTNPQKPIYFDITGWLEDTFPTRWASGTASAFNGSFEE